MEAVCFRNYHAPDEVRLFTVPRRGVRRWDQQALVYDVRVGEDRVLRHYSFPDRWFEVNCSLDLAGRFVTERHHGVDWCFNCDLSTPTAWDATGIYNMDLWLDVLVEPDGRTHAVIDEDDFAEAIRHGWLTPAEQAGARQGLADLLATIRGQGLLPFLEQVCPFEDVVDCDAPPPWQRLSPAGFPLYDQATRDQFWGRRIG